MMDECKTCQLSARRNRGEAPDWDNIYRTAHWDVVHSYNTSLLGWIVLVPQNHRLAIADLSAEEAAELGGLLKRVSAGLHELTGCIKTYVMQFAEHPQHPHVHFHVVPRMAGQPLEVRSYRVLTLLGVPQEEQVTEAEMDAFALRLRTFLQDSH